MPKGDPPLTMRDLEEISVTRLKGVTAKQKKALGAVEIRSVLDLLMYYPRAYLDRRRITNIRDLEVDKKATVFGRVVNRSTRRVRDHLTLTEVVIVDGEDRLTLAFFNQKWLQNKLSDGQTLMVHGKCELFNGRRRMAGPIVDLIGNQTGRFVPVYPQSEKHKLFTQDLQALVEEALDRCRARGIDDPLPSWMRQRFKLMSRSEAVYGIHQPDSIPHKERARQRLVFDELLRVQLALVQRKRRAERETVGISHQITGDLTARFTDSLPFSLTATQKSAIAEIGADLKLARPMHRLLQGDVGSGKTVVAVHALLVAVQGGYQGALMAPTEVLAEQHYAVVAEVLGDLSVPDPATLMGERALRVELLAQGVGAAQRRQTLADLVTGRVDIVIGTHALIQDKVEYQALGVVVIDEQHRFGVEQRAALRDKGQVLAAPDVLVMTATPIPRTAAMTLYGDLDVSVLDELPPGRTPIITTWNRGEAEEKAVWDTVRAEVANGRQVYVVCPLIGESAALDARAAEQTLLRLQEAELAGLRLGLLHGRMLSAEKDATMGAFRRGDLDVLVATTVIEVGVDVPNATVMVILDADRFGIAQLHQLRGRVGRGAHASQCFLVGDPTSEDSEARLKALVASTDGFKLAEVDLQLRGEGSIMGVRQKGDSDLRLASLRRDEKCLRVARRVAFEIIDRDEQLVDHHRLADELDVLFGDADTEFLMKD